MDRINVLVDATAAGVPQLKDLPPIREPRLPPNPLPVSDNGEPLERLTEEIKSVPVYALEQWPGAVEDVYLRAEVNARLRHAQADLPPGFGFVVLDGWRSPRLQKALYEHYYVDSGLPLGYVADPDDPLLSPPHSTGGAVDLTLTWDRHPLRLGTDFDAFVDDAHLTALEQSIGREPERSLRRLLTHALSNVGFCPFPLEWWHFSYGDQVWAFNNDRAEALYGFIPNV